MEQKDIKEFPVKNAAWFLIDQHIIGDLRDSVDLRNAQFHSQVSVAFALDILKNIKGSINEKIEFLKKSKEEITKFKVKE